MFRARLPLGRVAGIAVGVHWSVLVVFLLIAHLLATAVLPAGVAGRSPVAYWSVAVLAALCFLGSLLAHELAHAVVAKRCGMRVRRITLWLLGGVAELTDEAPNPRAEFRVAVVGPLTSFAVGAIGVLVLLVLADLVDPLVVASVAWIAGVNVVIAVFNLLPGAPLDGGRVLRAFLWHRWGDRERAGRGAARVGVFVGGVLGALGLLELVLGSVGGLWLMLLGWFLVAAASAEFSASAMRERLAGLCVADIMSRDPVVARGWWTVQTFLDRIAAATPHRVFPVVAFDGQPIGVVSLADLARLPAGARGTTPVSQACRPIGEGAVAAPGESLAVVISRAAIRPGRDLVVVMDRGLIAGVITASDVARAVERGAAGIHRRSPPDRAL